MAKAEIRFQAAVYKVQTLTDNGIRVTLDLPETAIRAMAMLAECQLQGIPLEFSASVDQIAGEEQVIGRTKRKGTVY